MTDKSKSGAMMINSVYSLSAKVVAMVFFLCFDISCARILDTDAYGEWVYFYAIITIVYSVVWFGVNASGKIFITRSPEHRRMEVLASALALRFFISMVLTMIYALVVVVMRRVEIFDPDKYQHLPSLLLLGSGVVFLNSFTEFLKEIFIGLIDFKGLLVINLCEYAGYFIFGLIGLVIRKNVYSIIYGFLLALTLTVFIGFWIILRKYHLGKKHFKKEMILTEGRAILGYAKYIALSGIGAILLTEIDTFMLGYFREGYDTAVYSVAKQFTSKAVHVNLALASGMMPAFADITIENGKEKRAWFGKVMLCNGTVIFGITGCFLLLGKWMIRMLYGEKYLFAIQVLYFLLPFYVISGFSKCLELFLDYQYKAKVRSVVFFMTIVFDIILNAVWIPKYGAVGAAIATDIAMSSYLLFLFVETGIVFKEYTK